MAKNGSDIDSPDRVLMNGKGAYMDPLAKTHESFTVKEGTNAWPKNHCL